MKSIGIGIVVLAVLATLGFFLVTSQRNQYLTSSSLPSWVSRGVEVTSNQLFESFKITANFRAPKVDDIFPKENFVALDGTLVSLRKTISVLMIGSENCSSCDATVKALKSNADVQIIRVIPYGSISTSLEKGIHIIDARLDQDKKSTEIIPSSGKLKTWIGMAQFIGAYVLDSTGRVYLATFQAPQLEQLSIAIERIKRKQPPVLMAIQQPQLAQELTPPSDASQRTLLEPVLSAKTGVIIFTAKGCGACEGLDDELKSSVQKWLQNGVSVAVVDSGRQKNGELMSGVPIIADPDNKLSNSWGRIGLPQATILEQGKYAGTTPFAESQFKRQLPGQAVESFVTKAPFTQAVGNSIIYIQEKRGDKTP